VGGLYYIIQLRFVSMYQAQGVVNFGCLFIVLSELSLLHNNRGEEATLTWAIVEFCIIES
jgi:hypothetical protein